MSCDITKLTLYWSNELSAQEAAKIEAHVATCAGCQKELAELTQLHSAVSEMQLSACPRDMVGEVLQTLPEEPRKAVGFSRAKPLTTRKLAALAASLLVIAIGTWASLTTEKAPPTPVVATYSQAPRAKALKGLMHANRRMKLDQGHITPNFRARAGTLAKRVRATKRSLIRNRKISRFARLSS